MQWKLIGIKVNLNSVKQYQTSVSSQYLPVKTKYWQYISLSVQKMDYHSNIYFPLVGTRFSYASMQLYWQVEYDFTIFTYTVLIQVTTSIPCCLGCAFCKRWLLELRKPEQVNMSYLIKKIGEGKKWESLVLCFLPAVQLTCRQWRKVRELQPPSPVFSRISWCYKVICDLCGSQPLLWQVHEISWVMLSNAISTGQYCTVPKRPCAVLSCILLFFEYFREIY